MYDNITSAELTLDLKKGVFVMAHLNCIEMRCSGQELYFEIPLADIASWVRTLANFGSALNSSSMAHAEKAASAIVKAAAAATSAAENAEGNQNNEKPIFQKPQDQNGMFGF